MTTATNINPADLPAADFVEVPGWIETDITVGDVHYTADHGCSSGAYMPAVTYSTALQVMTDYGDDVMTFIEEDFGEVPDPPAGLASYGWSSLAAHYLSLAVELWAQAVRDDLPEID